MDHLRREGYLPAAIANFSALCGWSPGSGGQQAQAEAEAGAGAEAEIMGLHSLTQAFALGQVQVRQ